MRRPTPASPTPTDPEPRHLRPRASRRSRAASAGGRSPGPRDRRHPSGGAHLARQHQGTLRIGLGGRRRGIPSRARAEPQLRLRLSLLRLARGGDGPVRGGPGPSGTGDGAGPVLIVVGSGGPAFSSSPASTSAPGLSAAAPSRWNRGSGWPTLTGLCQLREGTPEKAVDSLERACSLGQGLTMPLAPVPPPTPSRGKETAPSARSSSSSRCPKSATFPPTRSPPSIPAWETTTRLSSGSNERFASAPETLTWSASLRSGIFCARIPAWQTFKRESGCRENRLNARA